jgi:hypothetical protein
MKKILAAHYLLFIALIVGCAQIGLPKAEDFNERLTAGYSTVTILNDTATKLLIAKKIGSDDAEQVRDQTRSLKAGLDIARKMQATDPKGADSKLTAIRAALSSLNIYLTSKGG